ncbi:hypothetical protein DL991_10425 [Amycolatopsis sp. WAC 01375]|uniref:SAM-dependent methyltransferase n=1 Tax=Amycolatopsis sp. WAC 01375 TaxID=2203194 RepID=UPI000F78F75C|nr:SAM-dependent methyltransferase [Amycolatopsis sp. WAC 01375]RSM80525.1 hypothetical protein DL991_10425 [Amycolatopsis sp. WAC 01375]
MTHDPYSLPPHGTLPHHATELAAPTVARVNGVLADDPPRTITEMGIFEADRILATMVDAAVPGYRWALRAQQQFLAKVIAHAARKKITQFVILRAPLPSGPNQTTPHTIVKAHVADPTTVMVAREEIPAAHLHLALEKAQILHGDDTRAAAIPAAVHEVHRPLHHVHKPGDWSLDLGKPLCLTMVGDPSHWPDDVAALIRAYHHEVADGSMLGVSALGHAAAGTEQAAALDALAEHLATTPEPQLTLRDREEVEGWFSGWHLESPGVAPIAHWAGPQPADIQGPDLPVWCAIATKASS